MPNVILRFCKSQNGKYLFEKLVKSTRRTKVLLILGLFLAVVAGFLFSQTYAGKNKLFIKDLQGYRSEVLLSHAALYFNEGSPDLDSNGRYDFKPLHSILEVFFQFGHNPLNGLWVPPGMKSCYNSFFDRTMRSDVLVYQGKFFIGLSCDYRTKPDDYGSKEVVIAMSPKGGKASIINPGDPQKASHIYHTKVMIKHVSSASEYEAGFTYHGVDYVISVDNGVTQTEFINVLTSIIRS